MENVLGKKRLLLLVIPLLVILGIYAFFHFNIQRKIEMKTLGLHTQGSDLGKPKEATIEGKIKVKYPQDYTLVLVGDSMTEKLGNSDELRAYLKKYYPNKSFEILNYGFGSTNILSVDERLKKETFHGRKFMPILNIAFDVILVESFGHNPLSEFPLEEGLKKQTEALDRIVEDIKKENSDAKVVFVATIAPNIQKYALNQVTLDTKTRAKWATERMRYIQNHIDFAKAHNIPLIDIYDASLKGDQGGNLDYIDNKDYIHPSPNGVYFISEAIAKGLFEQNILAP